MQNVERYSFIFFAPLLIILCSIPFAPAQAESASLPCPYSWTRNLHVGSVGNDVLKLQQFLNIDPATMIATNGTGSLGNESSSFGMRTKQAVARFQEKYKSDILSPAGIAKGTGSVGTLTRAKLNAICNVSTLPDTTATTVHTTPVATDMLTVTVPAQPVQTIVPSAASGVPFTLVTLTAGSKDVTVQNINVERVGLAADSAFQSIALNDPNGLQIGNQPAFAANHIAALNQSFVIPANTSETLSIVGNINADLTDFAGQMPALQIDSIAASSPVNGSFPFKGTTQTLNSTLMIGGATALVSPYDPDGATNRYINDKGVRFSGIHITANAQEDLTLSYIIWDQTGTASAHDLGNVMTFANGTSTPAVVQSDGKTYISMFNPAIIIPKGQSIDLSVQGDLNITGANRTAEFDIYDNSDDVGLSGNTYGFGDGISPGGNTAMSGHSVFITDDGSTGGNTGVPFYAGSITTIQGGTITSIGKN